MKILNFLLALMLVSQVCFASASRDWNGTTDYLETNTAETIPTTVSYLMHYLADTTGEGGFGRIAVFDFAGTGAAATSGLSADNSSCTGSQMRVTGRSDRATTDGTWATACTSMAQDVWQSGGMTLDASSATNDPTMYVDGQSSSINSDTNGTGSLVTAANEIFIGNVDDATRTFDGQINYVQIWDRVITAVEMAEAHFKPGMVAGGLIHFFTIWGDSPEVDHGSTPADASIGSGTTTSTAGSPHVMFGGGLPL